MLQRVQRLTQGVDDQPLRQALVDLRHIPSEDRAVLVDELPDVGDQLRPVRVYLELFDPRHAQPSGSGLGIDGALALRVVGNAGGHETFVGFDRQGARLGAVVGGLAGKSAAEAIDPTREHNYWRENFSGRDYVAKGSSFNDYGPAYDFGVIARSRYPGRNFDDVESNMSGDWTSSRGASSLGWDRAKLAARDAWNRVSPAK